jgi:hypothetical protein
MKIFNIQHNGKSETAIKVGQTLNHVLLVIPSQQRNSLTVWGLQEPLETARVRDNLVFIVSRSKPEYSVISKRGLIDLSIVLDILGGDVEYQRVHGMDEQVWNLLMSEVDLEQNLSMMLVQDMIVPGVS